MPSSFKKDAKVVPSSEVSTLRISRISSLAPSAGIFDVLQCNGRDEVEQISTLTITRPDAKNSRFK
jgi:hypothetical protein